MKNLAKMSLAIFAASFLASAPVIAADAPLQAPSSITKPDPGAMLKQKAADAVEQGKKQLEDKIGVNKKAAEVKDAASSANKDAASAKEEVVNVQQETVTVETPQGTAQETTTVITPEGPATPEAPAAPQGK